MSEREQQMLDLIARVRMADPAAADWITAEWRTNPDRFQSDLSNLIEAFIWSNTPQGGDYWGDLDDRMSAKGLYSAPVSLPPAPSPAPAWELRVKTPVDGYELVQRIEAIILATAPKDCRATHPASTITVEGDTIVVRP